MNSKQNVLNPLLWNQLKKILKKMIRWWIKQIKPALMFSIHSGSLNIDMNILKYVTDKKSTAISWDSCFN